MPTLYDHQKGALNRIKNGSIICGDVGSGKSRTGIAYYFCNVCGGHVDDYVPMTSPKDLYIITTAKKRDAHEWEKDLSPFLLSPDPEVCFYKEIKIVIDSWNNIKKYRKVFGAFFIFDEQRVIGSGEWVRSFLDICRKNKWVLLSATPGDKWEDYIPVFIANGFYRNRTEFKTRHIVYSPYSKYPKVQRYLDEKVLEKHRKDILVAMEDQRTTVSHAKDILVEYDKVLLKTVTSQRWNIFTDEPIKNPSEYGFVLRRIVNSDESRADAVLELFKDHPKVIIFYNFNYELDILRNIDYGEDVKVAEWNGQKHELIPNSEKWVYLVNYSAGSEGWNCIETDTIIFYSLNHAYRVMKQAAGRINRMNTPFTDLYYYRLKSTSWIDLAIARSLAQKKDFNISAYF